MTDDPENTWRFLAELTRQLDADSHTVTGRTVGAELGLDRDETERLIKALRRRHLIEEVAGAPHRIGDGLSDKRLEITPAGIEASSSGNIPG